jgi:hypothetical protein
MANEKKSDEVKAEKKAEAPEKEKSIFLLNRSNRTIYVKKSDLLVTDKSMVIKSSTLKNVAAILPEATVELRAEIASKLLKTYPKDFINLSKKLGN